MSETNLITVITVSKNNFRGLKNTIASFREQTYPNRELVIIDGGSTDGTVFFLENLELSGYFEFISELDNGIYDGMNKGAALASGELLIFMNSGDSFSSQNVLQSIADSYEKENWKWGYGLARSIKTSSQHQVYSFVPFNMNKLLLGIATIPHQAAVFQKELFKTLGGYTNFDILSADQQFMARAATRSHPKIFLDFFADFEGNGVGSNRKFWQFPLEMYRFRRSNHQGLTPLPMFDFGLTLLVVFCRMTLILQKQIREIFKRAG